MNKFVKACYDSWRCRRSIKIGIGFLILSLVLLIIPLGRLFADTLSVPNSSGTDDNGNWVQYDVSDSNKTTYTWYPDKDSKAKGVSFEAGRGNSKKNSFQSGFVGTGVYDDGYFTVTIAQDGSFASVTENDVSGDFMDINSIKIYFERSTTLATEGPVISRLEWGQNGRDLADLSGCQTGYWHWILTPGGNANILTATLFVTYSDNTQTQTTGGTRSGGASGAFHFDVYHTGAVAVSAYVEYTFSGNMNNPVLTISDSNCSDTTTTGATTTTEDTTTTLLETTTTIGETTTEAVTTTEATTTTEASTTSTEGVTTTTAGGTTSISETTTTVEETTTETGTTTEETTTTAETVTTIASVTTTTAGGTTIGGIETTTTVITETTASSPVGTVSAAGASDADKEGYIEIAGLKELPYTGVNIWFFITGILFIITGILTIAIPKYYKKLKYHKR